MALNELESRDLVEKNLRTIMNIHGIRTQKELAEILEVGPAQLCHVIKGDQYPTVYPFLANIQNKFGYSIDEFLFTEICDGPTSASAVSSSGYDGVYQVYYMAEGNSLKSGILLIKKTNSATNVAKAVLLSKMKVKDANSLFGAIKEQAKKGRYYGEAEYYLKNQIAQVERRVIYEGEASFSNDYMFVNLCNMEDSSRIMMTFYREYNMRLSYVGGLGTMATVGESRSKLPSAKYVGISRNSLDYNENEVMAHLGIKNIGTTARIDYTGINAIIEKYRTRIQDTKEFSVEEQNRLTSAKIEDFVMYEVSKRLSKELTLSFEQHEEWREFIDTNSFVKKNK